LSGSSGATTNTLIYLGGRQISDSVFDACRWTGVPASTACSALIFHWCLVKYACDILAGINGLTAFNSVLILTRGGPATQPLFLASHVTASLISGDLATVPPSALLFIWLW
jgi:hypothetical protein